MINLEKFLDQDVEKEPYDHLVVDGFIDESFEDKISKSFPKIDFRGSFPLESLDIKGEFKDLCDILVSDDFKKSVEKKFNIDLSNRSTMITVRGLTDERDGKVHIDDKNKILTFLLYLNPIEWESDGGNLRLLNSDNLDDYHREVKAKFGTLVAFRCVSNAWHGHKEFIGQRRSIQLNYVINEKYRKLENLRHRFSVWWKKNFKKIK